MEVLHSITLVIAAFWLGACPFSVWIGHWLLGKDIRNYGDHNPGAANVFRAGGRKSGFLAALLDTGKGVPFVILARSFFGLPEPAVFAVGLSAILGHAFSPILGFKGGKAKAVTAGVFLAVPLPEVFIVFAGVMLLCFFVLEGDSWGVVLATAGSLVSVVVTGASLWEVLFMFGVLTVITIKNFKGLQAVPRRKAKIYIGLGEEEQKS